MPENYAAEYLQATGGPPLAERNCWDLAEAVNWWLAARRPDLPRGTMMVEEDQLRLLRPRCGATTWLCHFAPVVAGLVHDAWHPDLLLPPEEYARQAFPGQRVCAEILVGED